MVRIKTGVPLSLIVFDLLFQMQEKSRQSLSKKGRNTQFLKMIKLDQLGRYDLFCLSIDEGGAPFRLIPNWKSKLY